MTTTDCATEITPPASQQDTSQADAPELAPEPASGGASRPLKGSLFGFAITVTVGLTLASWYVGVRIVSADEVAPRGASTVAPVGSAPVGSAPVGSAPADSSPAPLPQAPSAAVEVVPPAPLFLQVAGIGAKQDAGFVRSLQAKGFHAQIHAPNRDNENSPILIGPFSTQAEMEQAQRKLQSAGVLAIQSDAPASY